MQTAAPSTTLQAGTYTELRERIRSAGLLDPTPVFYALFVAGALLLAFGAIAAIILIGNSWWVIGVAALLPVASLQFAFVGHDGGHRQIFRSNKANDWLVLLTSTIFMGFSLSWWLDQHNKHHGMPNHEDDDPNINIGPLAFTPNQLQRKSGLNYFIVKHQGWLVIPINLLGAISKQVENAKYLYTDHVRYPIVEPVLTAAHIGGYLALLFLSMDPAKAGVFILVHYSLFGLYLAAVITPNHKGMPMVTGKGKLDFLYWQVLTARNIRGNRVVDYLYGGLNYQIEHHLFPSMPRPHLRQARRMVRQYCQEHGITHHETGVIGAYVEIIKSMHHTSAPLRGGKAGGPIVLDKEDIERMIGARVATPRTENAAAAGGD